MNTISSLSPEHGSFSEVMIPESQWASLVAVRLNEQPKVKSLWERILPYIQFNCVRFLLDDKSKFQAYTARAERAFERNITGKKPFTHDDIKNFDTALNYVERSQRPEACFKLAKAHVLHHLDEKLFVESVKHHDITTLNEEIHNMQRGIIYVTEVIETLLVELSHFLRKVQHVLRHSSLQGICEAEAMEEIHRQTEILRKLLTQSFDENSWCDCLGKEFKAASLIMDKIRVLEGLGTLPQELKDFTHYFDFMVPTYFLRATCYERMGLILSEIYENRGFFESHRPSRWLLTAETAEDCWLKAYRDYTVSETVGQWILEKMEQEKTIAKICRKSRKRVFTCIASNPKITSKGQHILKIFDPKTGNQYRKEKGNDDVKERGVVSAQRLFRHISVDGVEREKLVQQLLDAAAFHLDRENTLPAIDLYEELIKLDPDNDGYLHQLAKLHAGVEHRKRAIAYYEKLFTKDPSNIVISKELGTLYYRIGNYQQALVHLVRVTKQQPNDVEIFVKTGDNYMALNNFSEAINHYQYAATLAPDDPHLKTRVFDTCIAAGDYYYFAQPTNYHKAAWFYQKAYQEDPKQYRRYLNRLIESFCRLGKSTEAMGLYEELMQKFPVEIFSCPHS